MMDLETVEAVVRRLYSDDEFRAAATVNPVAALAEYQLGTNERAALASLCERIRKPDDSVNLGFWF